MRVFIGATFARRSLEGRSAIDEELVMKQGVNCQFECCDCIFGAMYRELNVVLTSRYDARAMHHPK
jgi:hypothetical protein